MEKLRCSGVQRLSRKIRQKPYGTFISPVSSTQTVLNFRHPHHLKYSFGEFTGGNNRYLPSQLQNNFKILNFKKLSDKQNNFHNFYYPGIHVDISSKSTKEANGIEKSINRSNFVEKYRKNSSWLFKPDIRFVTFENFGEEYQNELKKMSILGKISDYKDKITSQNLLQTSNCQEHGD